MKKTLLVLAMTGLCFSAAARDISFGTEATYAPFEFYDENNQLVGFDIDVANKICEELKRHVNLLTKLTTA